jgi:hypothetical protein
MNLLQKFFIHPRAYLISMSIYVVLLLVIFSSAIMVLKLDRPYWGDEDHFVPTVRYFMSTPLIQAIQDYPELTTPLSFILYAGWGQLFGESLPTLRSMSLVLGFATALVLHRLIYDVTRNPVLSLLAGLWLFVNPYVFGASLFVFTDIAALFFLILAVWAAYHSRPLVYFFAAATALLTRQYIIFFVMAVGVYSAVRWLIYKDRTAIFMFASSVLSILPVLGLVTSWGGLSPAAGRQAWLHGTTGLAFYPFYLTDYISTYPVYIFPFLLMAYRSVFRSGRLWLIAIGLSIYYFAFPVAPSWVVQAETNLVTIGYFHRLLKIISPWPFLEHAIFYIMFVIGVALLLFLIQDGWKRLRHRQIDINLLLDLAIISFFLLMLFSFHVWEKYLLPVLPLFVLRVLLTPGLLPSRLNTWIAPPAKAESLS